MMWHQLLASGAVLALLGSTAAAQSAPQPVGSLPFPQWQRFTDPNENAFQVDVPRGWQNQGGTARYNALQFRNWVAATSPDGDTILALGDPRELSYIQPSQLMAYAGLRPGSIYDGGGGTRYIVAPYQNGQQFAVSWGTRKLQAFCTNIRVSASRARDDLAQRINAYSASWGLRHSYGEAMFTCTKGGIQETAYVFTGTMMIQGGIWYSDAMLGFVAPTRLDGLAAGMLAHILGSLQLNPQWVINVTHMNTEVSQIMAKSNASISDSIMKTWEAKGASFDNAMEEGSRERLGIDVYRNPATGDEYTVPNTSQYYWQNARGQIVGTDTDTSPGPDFTRMARQQPGGG